MKKLANFWKKMLTKARALHPVPYTASGCGHKTKRAGDINVFDHTVTIQMPLNEDKGLDWCLECIGKMAIRCAWCGEPILIGHPVTLYSPGPREGFYSSAEPSATRQAREQ